MRSVRRCRASRSLRVWNGVEPVVKLSRLSEERVKHVAMDESHFLRGGIHRDTRLWSTTDQGNFRRSAPFDDDIGNGAAIGSQFLPNCI